MVGLLVIQVQVQRQAFPTTHAGAPTTLLWMHCKFTLTRSVSRWLLSTDARHLLCVTTPLMLRHGSEAHLLLSSRICCFIPPIHPDIRPIWLVSLVFSYFGNGKSDQLKMERGQLAHHQN